MKSSSAGVPLSIYAFGLFIYQFSFEIVKRKAPRWEYAVTGDVFSMNLTHALVYLHISFRL